MPLHEVVVRADYYGQECINRYNYISAGTPTTINRSQALVDAMGYDLATGTTTFFFNTVAGTVQAMVSSAVTFVDILAKNVYDPTDFYTYAFPSGTTGSAETAGEPMSPAFAYGFRSVRTRLDIKRGFKRFVGCNEGPVGPGGEINATHLTGAMEDVAFRLGETITFDNEGVTTTFTPVIVKKFAYTTPSGNTAYRYATEADGGETAQLEQVAVAEQWQPYTQVRTQVSRQYGRGR